jgi:hypothetical protein
MAVGSDVNEHLRSISGQPFTAKIFELGEELFWQPLF